MLALFVRHARHNAWRVNKGGSTLIRCPIAPPLHLHRMSQLTTRVAVLPQRANGFPAVGLKLDNDGPL
jgi:hypothetical protein